MRRYSILQLGNILWCDRIPKNHTQADVNIIRYLRLLFYGISGSWTIVWMVLLNPSFSWLNKLQIPNYIHISLRMIFRNPITP